MNTPETLYILIWGLVNFLFVVLIFCFNVGLTRKDKEEHYVELVELKFKRVAGCRDVLAWMIVYIIFHATIFFINIGAFYIIHDKLPSNCMYLIYLCIAVDLATIHYNMIDEYHIIKDIVSCKSSDYVYTKYYKNKNFVQSNSLNQLCMLIKAILSIVVIAFT